MADALEAAALVAEKDDYFFQESILSAVKAIPSMDYWKTDFLFKRGIWREQLIQRYKPPRNLRVLFIGHSDLSLGIWDVLRLRLRSGCNARIYASNLSVSPRAQKYLGVRPLPLGLTNPVNDSPQHAIYSDTRPIIATVLELRSGGKRKNFPRIYANFRPESAPQKRAGLWRLIEELPEVRLGEFSDSKEGRVNYLREMSECGLALCPEGNGLDTHRFYESLYVGSIPIVLKTSYSAFIGRVLGLPHIGLRSWEDLRDSRLIHEKAMWLLGQPWNLEPITLTFWKQVLDRYRVSSIDVG